eukprot:GEMP01040776.1.p1 GENE.GEMP01040776.1~~GEMP01040776.1.p1  ORF type:complete len:440 (+),score=50.92 GEMP01040776.1:64-1320(+)
MALPNDLAVFNFTSVDAHATKVVVRPNIMKRGWLWCKAVRTDHCALMKVILWLIFLCVTWWVPGFYRHRVTIPGSLFEKSSATGHPSMRKPFRVLPLTISVYSLPYGDQGHRADTKDTCPYRCKFVRNEDPENADAVFVDLSQGVLPPWKKKSGQRWIGQYWESPEHRSFPFDADFMSHFDYTSGYRADSTFVSYAMMTDTLSNWTTVMQPNGNDVVPFSVKSQTEMMSLWVSNCHVCTTKRLELAGQLEKLGVSMASYGACLNNKGVAKVDKVQKSRQHRFMFAAENSRSPYYHTEKIYHAYLAGSIPVYLGSRTIKEYAPPGSYIDVDTFSTASQLAQHLINVATIETLYNSYFAFRERPLPDYIARKVKNEAISKVQRDCNLCKSLHTLGPAVAPAFLSESIKFGNSAKIIDISS